MSNEITNELILEEIYKSKQEIKATVEAVEARILLKFEEYKTRINDIEQRYMEIADRLENIERTQKRNNVVIFGLQKNPQEINIDFITSEIKKLLDIDIIESDLNNFYTLGKTENCPLKLEFVSNLKKTNVLKNAKRLKGTKISVVHDLTVKQREENRTIRKHLFIAKQNKNSICYIKKNKLHINDKEYTAQELIELEDIDDENVASQSKDEPETSTSINLNKFSYSKPSTLCTEWKKKSKTQWSTPDIFLNVKEDMKETTQRPLKEAKEDKVKTRSKK